uniref:Secreted protein n=1 Tax=Brugia timori TaxID=42155 RepID=A0A0R3QVC0_9BILA
MVGFVWYSPAASTIPVKLALALRNFVYGVIHTSWIRELLLDTFIYHLIHDLHSRTPCCYAITLKLKFSFHITWELYCNCLDVHAAIDQYL